MKNLFIILIVASFIIACSNSTEKKVDIEKETLEKMDSEIIDLNKSGEEIKDINKELDSLLNTQ